MNYSEKFKSIQFRLFIILCISTVFVIFALVLINSVVLESFYKYEKTKTARDISTEINKYYNSTRYYDIKLELKELEIRNNIEILIEDENSEEIYSGNKEIIVSVENLKNNRQTKTIYKNENTVIKSVETAAVEKYMILQSKLDNGYVLYIRIPITPINETVRITNNTLWFIGIMMIIISGIMSSFVSRKFTEPIVQLNNITKKMAKLDFSEKYRISDTEDEINKLGKNINEMSDKLEATIGQLRKNNDELERDIEEKAKIDEMRKQFISDVSHELKTPISLVQGYAEGLLENVNEDEESRKFYAEVIIDESNKMDKMVKELLELMKLEYQERQFNDEEFDLNEVINEEIRRHTVILKDKDITVEFDDSKKMMVFADQEYIEQVVNNYFTNAIKHCEKVNEEKKIIIRTEKKNKDKVRLYVYNTGKRIPKDYLNKIWGRFYKMDSSRSREDGGSGIGLALVKAIMNNYHNEYGVTNYDDGVEFYCDINIK